MWASQLLRLEIKTLGGSDDCGDLSLVSCTRAGDLCASGMDGGTILCASGMDGGTDCKSIVLETFILEGKSLHADRQMPPKSSRRIIEVYDLHCGEYLHPSPSPQSTDPTTETNLHVLTSGYECPLIIVTVAVTDL